MAWIADLACGCRRFGSVSTTFAVLWTLCGCLHNVHYVESRIMWRQGDAEEVMPGDRAFAA